MKLPHPGHRFAAVALALCGGALFAAPSVSADNAAAAPKTAGEAKGQSAEPPAIDPKATALLARSREYLQSLTQFRIRANTVQDDVVGGNFKLQRAESVDLKVRRPNNMRIEVTGEGDEKQEIVDDGKTLSLLVQPQKYYATMSALSTLPATLDVARARYGIKVPLVDVIVMAAGEDLGKGVTRSRDIGEARCGDSVCEHLAFRGKVDWQVWIDKGEKPLPRKIIVTTRDDPAQPQYSAALLWDTSPDFDDQSFAFSLPSGAAQMALPKPGPASHATEATAPKPAPAPAQPPPAQAQ